MWASAERGQLYLAEVRAKKGKWTYEDSDAVPSVISAHQTHLSSTQSGPRSELYNNFNSSSPIMLVTRLRLFVLEDTQGTMGHRASGQQEQC